MKTIEIIGMLGYPSSRLEHLSWKNFIELGKTKLKLLWTTSQRLVCVFEKVGSAF